MRLTDLSPLFALISLRHAPARKALTRTITPPILRPLTGVSARECTSW